jgi:hypothetical protein
MHYNTLRAQDYREQMKQNFNILLKQGLSQSQMAEALNHAEIYRPSGGLWSQVTVSRFLKLLGLKANYSWPKKKL